VNNDAEFQMVCRDCGTLGIKIESPVDASPETVVRCSNCDVSRGTIGALRDLATRLQALGRSAKLKSGSELVSLHRELQSLRRKVQTAESTPLVERQRSAKGQRCGRGRQRDDGYCDMTKKPDPAAPKR